MRKPGPKGERGARGYRGPKGEAAPALIDSRWDGFTRRETFADGSTRETDYLPLLERFFQSCAEGSFEA
jgi:hypothetical protein